MRYLPLSLVALGLAACGSGGSVDPDARMPTPYPEDSDGPVTEIESASWENPITTTEASGTAIEGEWSTTSISGDPAAVFTGMDENRVAAVICREADEEGQQNSVTLRFFVDEDTEFAEDSSIAIYTSAGSKAYAATSAPIDITTPIGNYFGTMIGSGRGDIRIVFDEEMTVIPTSDAVRQLVRDCRPEMEYQGPQQADEDEEEGEDEE